MITMIYLGTTFTWYRSPVISALWPSYICELDEYSTVGLVGTELLVLRIKSIL